MEWIYALTLPGPSSDSAVVRRGSDILHFRINALPESPWAGRSPLLAAGFSSKLLANVESRASEEASARSGHLLQTPNLSAENDGRLRADLKGLKGGIATVEATGGNFQRGAGPSREWTLERIGATFPESNVKIRKDVGADVVSAFGIPSSLYAGSEGASVRGRLAAMGCRSRRTRPDRRG